MPPSWNRGLRSCEEGNSRLLGLVAEQARRLEDLAHWSVGSESIKGQGGDTGAVEAGYVPSDVRVAT